MGTANGIDMCTLAEQPVFDEAADTLIVHHPTSWHRYSCISPSPPIVPSDTIVPPAREGVCLYDQVLFLFGFHITDIITCIYTWGNITFIFLHCFSPSPLSDFVNLL